MTFSRQAAVAALAVLAASALSGCHHSSQVAYQPPPPAVRHTTPAHRPVATDSTEAAAAQPPNFFDDTSGAPVFTETGIASWYGPNYHRRAAADGTLFDQNQMTAAHRTLPLGSTVRVTNLATGEQVLVRITDRGPFAPGRVLDLSMGAAKAVGIYRAGLAKVRVEAFAHATTDPEGKWCVQTGAFKTEDDAVALKTGLLDRFRGSKVTEFAGPTGYWVRIDPPLRTREQAAAIADWIGVPDPAALPYIVRLD